MPEDDEFLTSTQAGQLFGKSSRTVLRLMEAGTLPTAGKLSGINGPYLFRRRDVERYVESIPAPAGGAGAS
ncbi:hypothetical protein ASG84_25490 [Rhodococcus sp. Leaf278]|uniref:helix-turn-helix domain-containing protein n=1 Tax=Rhodococcus sp. Leaf278 TaxID=1736319 RepID=UPI00070CED92|nr:helix-turn-helix domain-containing protein [Rhodococcus sp. Leaf278]KQU52184.1 hypothetical protein ASG84_25490 [Rhodococcus sp. Leaf278]